MMNTNESTEEKLLRAVATELKRPVSIDPLLNQRVMEVVRRFSIRERRKRLAIWSSIGLALAAGVAAMIFFTSGQSHSSATPHPTAFVLEAPSASRVTLVGDFNNWDPGATPLTRVSSNGRWETVVPLHPGRYQFTFMVDGTRWVADPHAPAVRDDFGEPTSVITILPSARL
jgi:Glycogen recognition site of AMP-activated protein kinase